MIKELLARLGIHIHTWHYFTEYELLDDLPEWIDDMRECKCGVTQQYIYVPAAPGAFGDWLEV